MATDSFINMDQDLFEIAKSFNTGKKSILKTDCTK